MKATRRFAVMALALSISGSIHAQQKPSESYLRWTQERLRRDITEKLRILSDSASIKIVSYRSDGNFVELFIEVIGATSESKVAIFAADGYTNKYRPARTYTGDFAFASTIDQLRSLRALEATDQRSLEAMANNKSRWTAKIRYPSLSSNSFDLVVALYRVVEQGEWTETRLVDGFKYLPFEDGRSIAEVFAMIDKFGWKLDKYTSLQGK